MENVLLISLGMAVVTFLPRFLPMYILTRMEIPKLVIDWLRYVPVAVLAALIVPGILTSERQIFLSLGNSYLVAAIPAFLVAWRTKSMMLTVTAGMAMVLVLQLLPYV